MMDWILNKEPFFRTREDAEEYVTRELPPILPEGWKIERPSTGEGLTWVLTRISKPGEHAEWHNYRVQVSRGLDFVIFYWGNSDRGAFELHHVLQTALVIETRALRGFSLAECLQALLEQYEPNRLGLT